MKTLNARLLAWPLIVLSLTTLASCATSSAVTPVQAVVGAKVKLTPLAADVKTIDPNASAPLLKKHSNFREKVRALSASETTK